MATQPIYQFYAELMDYTPRIWRRFQVPKSVSVACLGYCLMTLFEMQGNHLFALETPDAHNQRAWIKSLHSPEDKFTEQQMAEYLQRELGKIDDGDVTRFAILSFDGADHANGAQPPVDAAKTPICNVLIAPGQRIIFNYDFGDNWIVAVELEQIIVDKELPNKELPRVLEGKGFGIVEDCGGACELMNMRKAFAKKSGEAYREYCEWPGVAELDLDAFDLEDMNFRLKKLPRIFKELYEDQLAPTQYSIKLLQRAYKQ